MDQVRRIVREEVRKVLKEQDLKGKRVRWTKDYYKVLIGGPQAQGMNLKGVTGEIVDFAPNVASLRFDDPSVLPAGKAGQDDMVTFVEADIEDANLSKNKNYSNVKEFIQDHVEVIE